MFTFSLGSLRQLLWRVLLLSIFLLATNVVIVVRFGCTFVLGSINLNSLRLCFANLEFNRSVSLWALWIWCDKAIQLLLPLQHWGWFRAAYHLPIISRLPWQIKRVLCKNTNVWSGFCRPIWSKLWRVHLVACILLQWTCTTATAWATSTSRWTWAPTGSLSSVVLLTILLTSGMWAPFNLLFYCYSFYIKMTCYMEVSITHSFLRVPTGTVSEKQNVLKSRWHFRFIM